MADLTDEKWREMEAEMDRFEEEISAPNFGVDQANKIIIGAGTFNQVQARLEKKEPVNYGGLPPPPPPPSFGQATAPQGPQMPSDYSRAPPPPPPMTQPAFLPPQLRNRPPGPPRMRPPPPPPMNRPMGPPPMGPPRGPPMGGRPPMMPPQRPPPYGGPPGPHGGPPGGPPGPHGMPPRPNAPPGYYSAAPQIHKPPEISKPPAVVEAPKVVYSAPPVKSEAALQKEQEKKEKKRKRKKLKTEHNPEEGEGETAGPAEDIDGVAMDPNFTPGVAPGIELNVPVEPVMPDLAFPDAAAMMEGAAQAAGSLKKEKKEKKKKFVRMAAGQTWEDPTLAEWENDDFRMFCGDLGNEVTDETLTRVFSKFPTFIKAKVVRDKKTNKTKGYGFVSFRDPNDFARAMREMNGKYVGNRPIKLRKSNWKDRQIDVVRKKEKEKKRLGFR